jgi:NAD(P)-dependent dehydrogenase (short-subunit alcohol dehydrogenase family)
MLLKNHIAIITGAGGGLGTTFAKKLAEEGAKIILTDVNKELLKQPETELTEMGFQPESYVMDVTNKEQIQEVFKQVFEKYGEINILINNAGGSLYTPRELDKIQENDWDKVLDVNLKGTFLCCQDVVPYMAKNNYGRIINVSSIGGRTASLVTGVAYAAAKGGVIAFSRRLAKEVGKDGITVNTIAPGTVLSGQRMLESWESMADEDKNDILRSIPLGRLSTAEEQADVAVFLSSNKSSYMTGAVIDINGGRLMS